MAYEYETLKPQLLTDDGQRMFIQGRDEVLKLMPNRSDSVLMGRALDFFKAGDSWLKMACVDRMVEIGDLHEISGDNVVAQHRVFVRAR
ncbi:hypothetical protein LCGC14_0164300 [marine sediment metagenome]|uniref:Uncharacterized protein n=1 Tax=marine sediment metagenome TaxID=412755 RepID=A0A0F9XCU4_9ZZZZ